MPTSQTCSRGHSYTGMEPCSECYPGYRRFEVKAKVWLYPGEAAWHFVTLPKKVAKTMNDRFEYLKKGFGSLRVEVTVGETSWRTSVFPDKTSGSFVLPLKAQVRKKEGIEVGKSMAFVIEVLTE